MGTDIDDPLQKPEMLHARITAIGPHRTFIRNRLREINSCIPEAINAGKNLRPDHAPKRLVTRVAPTIVDMARGNCRNHSILVQRHARIAESALVAVCA